MRNRTLRRQVVRSKKLSASHQRQNRAQATPALAALLIVDTLLLYGSARDHAFINYDNKYVTGHSHVVAGLTFQTVLWSLTSTEQCNWRPVTWLSHALDYQSFGLDAGYHHLSSLVLHVLNMLLLFLFLRRAPGNMVGSFLVSAVFAWHPVNVESVAWVAERKIC